MGTDAHQPREFLSGDQRRRSESAGRERHDDWARWRTCHVPVDAVAELQRHAGNCFRAYDAGVQESRDGVEGDSFALVARSAESRCYPTLRKTNGDTDAHCFSDAHAFTIPYTSAVIIAQTNKRAVHD